MKPPSPVGQRYLVRLLARQFGPVNTFAEDVFQPLGLTCFFGRLEAADTS